MDARSLSIVYRPSSKRGATMTTPADRPRIGFVGLGVMGRPMAANLVRAGYACTVYDINPTAMAQLASLGAPPAETGAEVAEVSEIFITMVVNDAQMRAILFEPGNAVQAFAPGATVIGMSTMSRAFVQDAGRAWSSWGSRISTRR